MMSLGAGMKEHNASNTISEFEEALRSTPEITVIVPIYNSELHLSQCLESVRAQTVSNFECILVNDGSTDSSSDICREFCKKDQRFMLFCQPNSGVSSARNLGLNRSRGKYVVFLDSDDFVEPTYLYELHKAMQRADLGVVRTIYEYDHEEHIKRDPVTRSIAEQQMIETEVWLDTAIWKSMDLYIWDKMFCADIIHSHGLCFDRSIFFAEDALFLAQYCAVMRSDHVCVSKAEVHHYRTDGATSFGHFHAKVLTAFPAFDMIEELCKSRFPRCVTSIQTFKCFLYMFFIYRMKSSGFSAAEIKNLQKALRESLCFILHHAKYYPFFLKLCSICMAYSVPMGCLLFSPVFDRMLVGSDNHG